MTSPCRNCRRSVEAVFHGPRHALHACLTLATCGAWLWPWILLSWLGTEWRCPTCGCVCHPEVLNTAHQASGMPKMAAGCLLLIACFVAWCVGLAWVAWRTLS